MTTGRLAGEVSIVTGATSGLGVEIARLLAEEGAATVVTGRDVQRGKAVVADIEAAGATCAFVPADVGDEADRRALVDATEERFGPATVLVNNAVSPEAIAADGPVASTTVDTWDQMLRVNLVAAASLCRLVIPGMRRVGHGSIVNVSSRAAERGTSGLAAYTASKGGLNALARSITVDYGRDGIRCNTVQPGYVLNAARDGNWSEQQRDRYRAMQMTRMTTARDVAYAVLFLASAEAEVITGVTLPVDGGSTAVRGLTLG
jgi:NAD(P)-dependent dehydrogenase (short-subunit alcohol dehydrogenase family)